MKSSKSLLTLLSCLAFFIAVLLFPMVTKAAPASGIVINGVEINSTNYGDLLGDGMLSFDPSTGTLTIADGYTLTNTVNVPAISLPNSAEEDLIINCLGSASINQTGDSYVILSNGNLTINGNLSITTGWGGGSAIHYSNSTTRGTITINGNIDMDCTANNTSTNAAIQCNNGEIIVVGNAKTHGFDFGLRADGITINGDIDLNAKISGLYANNGNITVTNCTNSKVETKGYSAIEANGNITIEGKMDIRNTGEYTINTNASGQNITLDGEISVTNTGASSWHEEGAIHAGGDMVLSGSISASSTGWDQGTNSTISSDGSITVDGDVWANNGNHTNTGLYAMTSTAGISILSGTTTLTVAKDNLPAIYTGGTLSIAASHGISTPSGGIVNAGYIVDSNNQAAQNVVISPKDFSVVINNDGNGTGSASKTTGKTGDSITLSATPNPGYRFKEWVVKAGGVTVSNDSFTIATDNVEIEAVFESVSTPVTYKVTVSNDGNGSASASATTGSSGDSIALTANPTRGYKFKEWQVVSGGVTVTNNSFTIGSSDVEIKAIFELDTANSGTIVPNTANTSNTTNSNSSSSSSNSSSSNNNATEASPAKDTVPKTGENNALPALFALTLASMLGMAAFGYKLKKNK